MTIMVTLTTRAPAGGRKYKLGALGAIGEPFANAFGNQRFVFVSFSFFFHDDP